MELITSFYPLYINRNFILFLFYIYMSEFIEYLHKFTTNYNRKNNFSE